MVKIRIMMGSHRNHHCTKMKFSIEDFFSKCVQILSFLRIWLHLLKKSLMENFIFVQYIFPPGRKCFSNMKIPQFWFISSKHMLIFLQYYSVYFCYFVSLSRFICIISLYTYNNRLKISHSWCNVVKCFVGENLCN